jgi:hypothetical protein
MKRTSSCTKTIVVLLGTVCFLSSYRPSFAREEPASDPSKIPPWVVKELRKTCDLLAREPEKNIVALDRIVHVQLCLKDLQGARKTFEAMAPVLEEDTQYFVEKLAVLEAETGDVESALKTLASVSKEEGEERRNCSVLLSVARAAAQSGRKAGAEKALARAIATGLRIEEGEDKQFALFEIGTTQIALGKREEARKTHRLLESLTAELKDKGQVRARALCQLGTLSAQLSDQKAAKHYFAESLRAMNVRQVPAADLMSMIAIAQAESGDMSGALATARSPSTLGSIAAIQLSRGDRAGAEETTKRIRHFLRYYSPTLSALAKSYANSGETGKALALAKGIEDEGCKAQLTLEIAASVAQRGDKKTARQIAEGIKPPLVLRDHKTWGKSYETSPFVVEYTNASAGARWEAAGDLTSAALLCRIALEGRGGIAYSEDLERWDVRKVARTQTAAGDASGSLSWVVKLSASKRLEGLLGMADGLALLANEKDRLGKKKD